MFSKYVFFLCLLSYASVSEASSETNWIREIEVQSDPIKEGVKDYTIRMDAEKTMRYDKITFECTYHQEYPWENARGRKFMKVSEPASFTYRYEHVRLIRGLDVYRSFKVPLSLERLQNKYGMHTFVADQAITVSRIRITALVGKDIIWSVEVPAEGKYSIADFLSRSSKNRNGDEPLFDE